MIFFVVVIVFILIAYFVLRILLPNKNKKGTYNNGRFKIRIPAILGVILCIFIVGLVFYYIRQLSMPVPDGEGILYEVANVVAPNYFPGEGDQIEISICLDQVTIGGNSYTDILEIQDLIYAYKMKGCSFYLVDAYALNCTYTKVYNTMINLGINPNDIEEGETSF